MISVVIPTLNEANNLPKCIEAIWDTRENCEVVVVDAGSADGTREIALGLGAEVIAGAVRQRAAQLNLGAGRTHGAVLLFLHADTVIPAQAFQQIAAALMDAGVGGGAFARKFDSNSIFLGLTCAMAEVRNRAIGWHLGDQAMFVRRSVFEKVGGFRLMDRFEDLDFSRRLGAEARVVTLRPPVITSARRFAKEGPLKRTAKDLFLTMAYLRGVFARSFRGTALGVANPAE